MFLLQNYTILGIALPFFTGLCRYGSNEVDSIGTFSNTNDNACHQKCKLELGCTAFAVDNFNNCILYRNGPYTKGDGYADIWCYVMPNSKFCCSWCYIINSRWLNFSKTITSTILSFTKDIDMF